LIDNGFAPLGGMVDQAMTSQAPVLGGMGGAAGRG